MSDLHDSTAIVVGAGVFGLAAAVAVVRAGGRVLVIDEACPGANASAIAAGMLAPAFEAALDPASRGWFSLLTSARDLWPTFAEDLGPTGLDRCGAVMIAPDEDRFMAQAALKAFGARFETRPGALFTPDDWRLEPGLALPALHARLLKGGGRIIQGKVGRVERKRVELADGSIHLADAVILACGYGGLDLAPEFSLLQPIKGQILRFFGVGPTSGPILRGVASYLAPGMAGAAAGASMQEGLSDHEIDPAITTWLIDQAAGLAPNLARARATAFTGVRASTPDGLPLIGRSRTGVWLMTGARRNGWLLAPLAAGLIRDGLCGQIDDPRFAPRRFSH